MKEELKKAQKVRRKLMQDNDYSWLRNKVIQKEEYHISRDDIIRIVKQHTKLRGNFTSKLSSKGLVLYKTGKNK